MLIHSFRPGEAFNFTLTNEYLYKNFREQIDWDDKTTRVVYLENFIIYVKM